MRSWETLTLPALLWGVPGALTIAINQVEYSNTPEGRLFTFFGRDPGRATAHGINMTGFFAVSLLFPEEQVGQAYPAQVTIEPNSDAVPLNTGRRKLDGTCHPSGRRAGSEGAVRIRSQCTPFRPVHDRDCGSPGLCIYRDNIKSREPVPAEWDPRPRVCMIDLVRRARGFPGYPAVESSAFTSRFF